MRSLVYDIETLSNCYTYIGLDINNEEIVTYVIHSSRNDLKDLVVHLNNIKLEIGFNNLNFDSQVNQYILDNYEYLSILDGEFVANDIYKYAQKVIETSNRGGFADYPEWKLKAPQLDLFRIWHYNNEARSISLKGLEVSMNYPNVMDMPINHHDNIKEHQISEILEYNLNDVKATYEFYKLTVKLDKLELRKIIQNKYGLRCLNWNNGRIGEQLILKLYCEKIGKDINYIRKLRTHRSIINLKDCIPETIKFTTKEFNIVKDNFYNKIVNFEDLNPENKKKKNSVCTINYKDCIIDYGLGGAHGVTKSGIYTSNSEYIIKSLDVASLYPNLPIVYNFYPEHLGPEFIEVYRDNIVNVRLSEKAKPKELQDKSIIDGFKEAANIPYGKSNEKFSFLYDTLFTMKTTISGQLVTSMLVERLGNIPDCKLLMYNTDGCEIIIPRKYEELYNSICKEWEKETKLVLEFADYQKMWINDINNYGCISTKGKIKNKGRFEVDKIIGSEPAYHKDNSFRVIPLAIENYFVQGRPIEDTIRNHNNIYDFCGRQRFKGNDYGEIRYLSSNSDLIKEKQQKTTRYYMSTNGSTFYKMYAKGSEEVINKGYKITIFNKFEEKKDYNIDYKFYILECYKILDVIESKQLELF